MLTLASRRVRIGMLALPLMGCGPTAATPAANGDGSSGTSDGSSESGAQPPPASTSGVDSTGAPTSEGTGLEPTGIAFVDDPDIGVDLDCDPYAQDCPPGQKCTWWSSDGFGGWVDTRCVPVADEPAAPGEPCTVEGSGTTGIDDCDFGSICFRVDVKTLEGTCFPLCAGNESAPVCDDPDDTCTLSAEGFAICLPHCDPVAQDCEEGQGCYPINDTWSCAPDASNDMGTYGDPCEFINVCDPGLICLDPQLVPGCRGFNGCCAEVCDLDDPECPDMELGVTCTPWYDVSVPPQYEHVGACTLPKP